MYKQYAPFFFCSPRVVLSGEEGGDCIDVVATRGWFLEKNDKLVL